MTAVELVGIKKNIISVRGVDIIDGTPLLDIKPYIESTDSVRTSDRNQLNEQVKDVKRPPRLDRSRKRSRSDKTTERD